MKKLPKIISFCPLRCCGLNVYAYGVYTVDNVHPVDLGFYLMANKLEPIIKDIIEKK